MEETAILEKISRIEDENNLYSRTLNNIPLYRLVRYRTRLAYINSKVIFKTRTVLVRPTGRRNVKFFSGFWRYLGKSDLTIFIPFNRLSLFNEEYFDKFIDPVIELSRLKDSNYVIIDPASYISGYNRFHREHVLSNETRSLFFLLLKVGTKLWISLFGKNLFNPFLEQVRELLKLPQDYVSSRISDLSKFYATYCYYLFWFKLLKPRRVMFVFREGNLAVLAACKKLSISVAEFQHGVTLDNTMAYTGEYDARIDPDFFLSFGDYWKPECFGMIPSKMIHIGWAYKQFMSDTNKKKGKEYVLVISSTAISTEILSALQAISTINKSVCFDIRLHPAESYNDEQKRMLSQIPNGVVVDNKQESYSVLSSYHYVIGEASSVLFEALSVGCKVGMLNMCGLRPPIDKPGIKENFFVINDAKDFEQFLSEEKSSSASKAEFYSDFDSEAFMNFINEKM